MFEVIIVSHGEYAKAMRQSAEMIVGKQEKIQEFGLNPGEDVDAFREQVGKAIAEAKEKGDVLVLTDMLAGSPFNVTASAMSSLHFHHIAGVNLPMLLEIFSVRAFTPAQEVRKNIVELGKTTIVDVNKLMEEVSK